MASQPTYDQGKLKTHEIFPFFPAGYEKPIFFRGFLRLAKLVDLTLPGPRDAGGDCCQRWNLCIQNSPWILEHQKCIQPKKRQVASKHFFSNTRNAQITNLYLVVSTHVKHDSQLELGNLVQIGCENNNISEKHHLGNHPSFTNIPPFSSPFTNMDPTIN